MAGTISKSDIILVTAVKDQKYCFLVRPLDIYISMVMRGYTIPMIMRYILGE